MKHEQKTREDLIEENNALRLRISEFENLERLHAETEKRLRWTEERLRILFEFTPDPYYLFDLKGNFIDGNGAAERLTGYPRGELIGRNFLELPLVHDRDRRRAADLLSQSAQGIPMGPDELVFCRKDGEEVLLQMRTFPTQIDGRLCVLGIAREMPGRRSAERQGEPSHRELENLVTQRTRELTGANERLREEIWERKAVEEKLRESQDRYKMLSKEFQAILDAIPDPLTLQTPDMRLVWANQGASEGMARRGEELIGQHCFRMWHGRGEPCVACPVQRSFRSGEAALEQVSTPDGKIWELRTVPIKDDHGRTIKVVEMARDITDLRLSYCALKQSLEEKETLLRELSHRTKNNIQVIASLLNLQSSTVRDTEALRIIREAQDRIRAIALVHEKLYRSHDLGHVNLREYFSDIAGALCTSYQTETDRIRLVVKVPDFTVSTEVAVPCGLILNELVSNSLKYAFPDGGRGEISIALSSVGADHVELRIGDNGVGLPEDFEFEKARTLGIRLVKQLAESQLSGRCEFRSEPGKGTEFVLRFRSKR